MQQPTSLETLSRARRMLAEARDLTDIAHIHDVATAARAYAKAAQLGIEATNEAAEIKLRAERRAGALLAQLERGGGGDRRSADFQTSRAGTFENGPASADAPASEYSATLHAVGIARSTAHRWQQMAQLPAAVFEGHIAEVKAAGEELTSTGVQRLAAAGVGRPFVAHNSGNHEWYTPAAIIAAARQVMGGIDLDPASCAAANGVVQAARFFDAEQDGLAQAWHGRIWLNPPYAQPLIAHFAAKLLAERAAGHVQQAIVLVNNATETRWLQSLLGAASAVCFPRGRLPFWQADGSTGTPLQGQVALYFGAHGDRFAAAFGAFGVCTPGARVAALEG